MEGEEAQEGVLGWHHHHDHDKSQSVLEHAADVKQGAGCETIFTPREAIDRASGDYLKVPLLTSELP